MVEGDQAAGLRQPAGRAPLGLLAFTPGADAQWVALLAKALRTLGRRPVVLDASRGRVAASLGLRPRHDLIHLLRGERDFDTVACSTTDGVFVVRGDEGLEAFAASGERPGRLLEAFSRLSREFDDLLLAMPPAELACMAPPLRAVPVLALDADAQGALDAYGALKQLAGFGYRRFACVVRHAHGAGDAGEVHARLAEAARRFLDADVTLAGWWPAAPASREHALAQAADTLLRTAAQPVIH